MTHAEQRRQYREMAWDAGCICPMLEPHVHLMHCPLYHEVWDSPAAVPDTEATTGEGTSTSPSPAGDIPRVTEKEREEAHAARRYVEWLDRRVHGDKTNAEDERR